MMITLSVEPSDRSKRLAYYHKNKELMNLQSFVNKLNSDGHEPMYAHKTAYQLFKDDKGKWRFPACVKEAMKERSRQRLEAEEAARSQPTTQPSPPII